jgi:DNA repair protein RecN (Recombination protein N)
MDLTFGAGLNILTGQTGAGKSILIGSMNLIIGEKASTAMVRSGAEEAFVEATFELAGKVPDLLSSYVRVGEPVLVRRQVIRGGRSYAFVNDHQVTVGKLKEIGDILLDLLGQHHHQSLLNVDNHRQLLDRFSVDKEFSQNYTAAFTELKERQSELETPMKLPGRGKNFTGSSFKKLMRLSLRQGSRAYLKKRWPFSVMPST